MLEMEKSERNLLVLGVLESVRHSKETTTKGKERTRERFAYSFHRVRVCVGAFRVVYGLGIKHFNNLLSHLEEYGPVPRVHGNKHKLPHNTLPFQDVKHAVTFIQNYATRFGIPHPAPLHGRDDMPPIFLPASGTYKSVHKEYVTSCTAANYRAAGIDLFCNIWHQCVPHKIYVAPCRCL